MKRQWRNDNERTKVHKISWKLISSPGLFNATNYFIEQSQLQYFFPLLACFNTLWAVLLDRYHMTLAFWNLQCNSGFIFTDSHSIFCGPSCRVCPAICLALVVFLTIEEDYITFLKFLFLYLFTYFLSLTLKPESGGWSCQCLYLLGSELLLCLHIFFRC